MAKIKSDDSISGDEIRNALLNDEGDPTLIEDLGEESGISSQDEVEECQGDSGTEQDGEETDTDQQYTDDDYYLDEDEKTEWSKKPPKSEHRKKSRNPSVIGKAKQAKTVLECWNNLFTDNIIETIVQCTNQYIDTIKDQFSRERDIRPTDEIELRAFIGLLYLAGVYKANHLRLEELWGRESDGIEKFGLVMNLKRFKTLIRCLRFDEQTTRSNRKSSDRLAAIRDVFEKFVVNCQNSYFSGENVTLDKMLVAFRGNCSFRTNMQSKPGKNGIKVFALVDAKMSYTMNMEIYAGNQPKGKSCVSYKPNDVVWRMAEPLFGSNSNITADSWFTDFDLIDDLKTQKLSYVGTVSKNKTPLPPAFVKVTRRAQYSSIFGFNDGKVLVSYVPHAKKNVILVSSLHDDDAIDPESVKERKPEVMTFYNFTKSGVDSVEKMCATYSVQRNTKCWPMAIFFEMLNVAGINSQVIYLCNKLAPLRRRLYLKTLANELVSGELSRRSLKTSGIPSSLQVRLKKFQPDDDQESSPSPPPPPKRRRCITCAETRGRRLSNHECRKCHSAICLSHATMICMPCYSKCDTVSIAEHETSESE